MRTTILSPRDISKSVLLRLGKSGQPLEAWWVSVESAREPFAEELRQLLGGEPICVIVVRDALFQNANAVMADFGEQLSRCREAVVQAASARPGSALGVVLLGRGAFPVAQASSPMTAPAWLPTVAGKVVSITIEDITWRVDAPLNSAASDVGAMATLMFQVENALVRRLDGVANENHNAGDALLELIREAREVNTKYAELLAEARSHLRTVRNPSAYRPSVRDGKSLLAHLWLLVSVSRPDKLRALAKALSSALRLRLGLGRRAHEPLVAVLFRPTTPEENAELRFTRGLLLCLYFACQLSTAAAHSDAYSAYPVTLLRSFSQDLLDALADAEAELARQADLT